MPVTAQSIGANSEAALVAALDNAGIRDPLLAELEAFWSLEQIWKAVEEGHNAASLGQLAAQRMGAGAKDTHPQPAAQSEAGVQVVPQQPFVVTPPVHAAPAVQVAAPPMAAAPSAAGWWDALFVAAGWSSAVGMLWLLNGAGTVAAFVWLATALLPSSLALRLTSLSPYAPVILGGLIGVGSAVASYSRTTPVARQLPIRPILVGVGSALVTAWVCSRPVTPTVIGILLGIPGHITISKTELLYLDRRAMTSWRVFPLMLAIATDVMSSLQGLLYTAHRLGWSWLTGAAEASLPLTVWGLRVIPVTAWQRLRVAAEMRPAYPAWTIRALIVTAIVMLVAVGTERVFRRVWGDFRIVWNHRPFGR